MWYALLCFPIANVLVTGYEENRLRSKYGAQFHRYAEHVGRWLPRKPYDSVD